MALERHRKPREDAGWPSCCSADEQSLIGRLQGVVGQEHVLHGSQAAVYTKGARIGNGRAVAVVRPGTLREAVAVVEACLEAGTAVLPQGANTGLTGGSVPRDESGREVVVVNTRRLQRMVPLEGGKEVLAYSGAGIHDLAEFCEGMGRESHSVLGSIFLNPSVGGGVALGSGGTQLCKGPVYTERLLYLRAGPDGRVELVDTLGLAADGGKGMVEALDGGSALMTAEGAERRPCYDEGYREQVCRGDGTVSRFNADVRGSEAVRSEGKVLVLASVHATFPKPTRSQTLWLGCRDYAQARAIRALCLQEPEDLPSQLEYINRDAFDVIDRAGRVLCTFLRLFGIGSTLELLWDVKKKLESLPGCDRIVDKLLYLINPLMPNSLSRRLYACGKAFDHNLLITIDDVGSGGYDRLIAKIEQHVASLPPGAVEYHRCTEQEGDGAIYFRFVMGTAFRSYCSGKGLKGLSVDYALPKNYEGVPEMPTELPALDQRMRVSHFGCSVFHEELVFAKDASPADSHKEAFKRLVEDLGGALPAEHGHGTEYRAPPETQARWQHTDPTNTFNPGVGKTTPLPNWRAP